MALEGVLVRQRGWGSRMNALVRNDLGYGYSSLSADCEKPNSNAMKSRLAALTQQLADEIAKLNGQIVADGEFPDELRLRLRREIKARRARERAFPTGLFADPAWDILLDLTLARLEHRQTSVSSLCIAASVPTTTALRWIKTLLEQGLIVRRPDRHDRRRHYIDAADATYDQMIRLMTAGTPADGRRDHIEDGGLAAKERFPCLASADHPAK